MKYHGGWSFFEAYNLPVNIRMWMIERLVKQNKADMEELKVTEAQIIKRFKCTIDEMNLEKLEALALEFKITRANRFKQ